jgi:hypothetical protein
MRVIITGGTGLIGRALATALAGDGHEVVVLSRNPAAGLPAGVRVAGWDGRTAAGWAALADGAAAIVNLAGESIGAGRWTARRKQAILESRVNAGRAVVEAVGAASAKPAVVLQSSAVGFYGPCGDERLTEDSAGGNDFLAGVCRQWEGATAPLEDLGVRRAVLRTGVVLSADGGALPRMVRPFKLYVGGPVGSGGQWFSWIHLADAVAAMRFLMESPDARGTFNLTAPGPVTNTELARTLGRVLHRPAALPVPAVALRLLFGEMSTVLLDGQRALPQRLTAHDFSFRFPELGSALRDVLG